MPSHCLTWCRFDAAILPELFVGLTDKLASVHPHDLCSKLLDKGLARFSEGTESAERVVLKERLDAGGLAAGQSLGKGLRDRDRGVIF